MLFLVSVRKFALTQNFFANVVLFTVSLAILLTGFSRAFALPAESAWEKLSDSSPANELTVPEPATTPQPLPSPTIAVPSAPTPAPSPTPEPTPVTKTGASLREAFLAAIKRGESMDIQKELLVQASESYHQAQNSFYPSLSLAANYTHQQTPTASSNPAFLSDLRTSKLTATMPLFRGLRDFAALRQRKMQKETQRFALQVAAKQLFFDVSQAFYNLLALESDEKNYLVEIEINRKRLKDLETYLRIGRSRQTDMLTLQANVSSLEAQLEAIRGQKENAKDVLAFFTNWDRSTEITDEESEFSPDAVEKCLEAVEQRADIRAAKASAQAASETIAIARGGHLPSLDLIGDSYFQRPGQPDGGPDWAVQVVVSFPIFQGGIVNSQVRQAQSVAHQSELQLSQARRAAGEEIRILHNSVSAEQKQLGKLEQTVNWAKKNYLSQLADYKNGLVTNLEVLTATSNYQTAVRTIDRQRLLHKLNGVKLQAAIGKRTEIDFSN